VQNVEHVDLKVLRNLTPSSTPTSYNSDDDFLESPSDINNIIALVAGGSEDQGSNNESDVQCVDPASLCRELCVATALQRANISSQTSRISPPSNVFPCEVSDNSTLKIPRCPS
jgi:hypothetical protein